MLLRTLLQIHDPKFNAIFFRRTGPQLSGPGSVWEEAKQLYRVFGARIKEVDREAIFPSGASIKFSHMEYDKNKEDHQGKQFTHINFDEGTHFLGSQITYLMSRLRSAAEVKSSMFISCNPDPDSFVATLIDWWLDDEGYPDPAKSGVIKYYGCVNDNHYFTDTEEEMVDKHPEVCRIWNSKENKNIYVPPKTITFIGGTIFDNPALIEANPNYLAELNALPKIEKARLLHGNWYARPEGSCYFQRAWLQVVDKIPENVVFCRAWDKAATEPSEKNKHPDYTASIKMAKDKHGFYYLIGDYHEENIDKIDCNHNKVYGRFRERPGSRDKLIQKQAEHDGTNCTVVFSQDPGAAGITEFTESTKELVSGGFTVKKDPMPTQSGKLTRYSPFASAAENGLVFLVKNSFNTATLEAYFKENEAFDGERSSAYRKDDWPDCTATAFNHLASSRVKSLVTRNQKHRDTLAKGVLGKPTYK